MSQIQATAQTQTLRRQIRRQRADLSELEQSHAARSLARNAKRFAPLQKATTVLSYLATGGEISTKVLAQELSQCDLFLPRVNHFRNNTMRFYSADNRLAKNRYGIAEPQAHSESVQANRLDVVLVPLVAFDRSGNRMGMGGGFYDRAFAQRLRSGSLKKPLLIGLAHHFQEVEKLERQAWDVPLDAIITDQILIRIP